MAKGLDAINEIAQQVQGGGSSEPSKLTYIKKNVDKVIVRIPVDIIDNLHVYQTYDVFQPKILTTLALHAEGRPERDYYHEAYELMMADYKAKKAAGEIDPKKEDKAYQEASALKPKPLILFGVIPLEDYKPARAKADSEPLKAGEPMLLSTNLGRDRANINALTNALTNPRVSKKFGSVPFEITSSANNQYTFTPLDMEDLTDEQAKVFKETEGVSIPDEVFDNAIFVSKPDKQLKEIASLGFNINRLHGVSEAATESAPQTESNGAGESSIEIGDDDLPF